MREILCVAAPFPPLPPCCCRWCWSPLARELTSPRPLLSARAGGGADVAMVVGSPAVPRNENPAPSPAPRTPDAPASRSLGVATPGYLAADESPPAAPKDCDGRYAELRTLSADDRERSKAVRGVE